LLPKIPIFKNTLLILFGKYSYFYNKLLRRHGWRRSSIVKIQVFISHNVPAVCDVFAARIGALRSKDQGCKNVGVVSRGNEA
jgi:hypothetical protein